MALSYDLPVVFHCGELHHCCPKELRNNKCNGNCYIDNNQFMSRPLMMLSVAKAYPDLTIILSHLGNPYFSETRQVMRECNNVYTDISGQFLSGTNEDSIVYRAELKKEIEEFIDLPDGAKRLFFGTDFPIQSYKDSLDLIEMLNISKNDKQKILYENAKNMLDYSY